MTCPNCKSERIVRVENKLATHASASEDRLIMCDNCKVYWNRHGEAFDNGKEAQQWTVSPAVLPQAVTGS